MHELPKAIKCKARSRLFCKRGICDFCGAVLARVLRRHYADNTTEVCIVREPSVFGDIFICRDSAIAFCYSTVQKVLSLQ